MELSELLRVLAVTGLRQRMAEFSILQRVRARHDVNGVDEELGCDACFFLILSKAKQTQARNDHNRGIRIS